MNQKKLPYSKYARSLHRQRTKKKKLLPFWLGLGGIVLIVMAIFAFRRGNSAPIIAPAGNGPSSLKVDKEKVDLGDIKLGQMVSVSFELTNVSSQPLEFKEQPYVEVKEGC